jgi:LPXTG-motif cell wall-anchored protein
LKGTTLRKIIGAAAGVAAAIALVGAGPALADGEPPSTIYAVADWAAIDTALDGTQVPAVESEIVDESTAVVTWSIGGTSTGGSSIETANLGAAVTTGDTITVDYAMSETALPLSGGARLFVYYEADADTLTEAPDQVAIADATSGTLTITADRDGTIGTAGVVYDSSGSAPGTVTYTDLAIGDAPVSFLPEPIAPPAEPTATNPTCDAPGSITIPEADGWSYKLDGEPVDAGTYDAEPGEHVVKAYHDEADKVVWKVTIADAPTDCGGDENGTDDGTDDGDESGSETGTEDGSETGSDDGDATGDDTGSDTGSEAGTDDGTDDGDETPTPTPSPTDDGTNDDDDDELPDTGSGSNFGLGVLGALLVLGGVVAAVVARRRSAVV